MWTQLQSLSAAHAFNRRLRNQLTNYQGNSDWRNLKVPSIAYLEPDKLDSPEIYERLIASYRNATRGDAVLGDGAWKVLSMNCHRELDGYLRDGDSKSVGKILAKMFRDPVTSGLALGETAYFATKKNPYPAALDWHDKAISFGQAVGVVPLQNPEQGAYGNLLHLDSIDVFRRSIERVGLAAFPPQVGSLFGVQFDSGVVPTNHLFHLYAAYRISTLFSDQQPACLEIGGGVGLLAYVAASMGIRQYCIVDLPLVNVLQGYVLLRSGLADTVQLYGEEPPISESRISLLPSNTIDEVGSRSFDLVINQDSLPEMGYQTMIGYIKSIQRISKGYFLSINQEARASNGSGSSQGWVHDVCRAESGMKLLYRAPYWLRKGYAEELYRIIGA